jgi:exodeoxyribonuclease VII large subunit
VDAVTSAATPGPEPGLGLPARAADTTAEQPWPVRLLSVRIGEYVDRMSVTWVEGQVVQLTRRPGARTAYLTLRDPDVDMSLPVAISVHALDAMPLPLSSGARVVVQAKPVFWTQRGSFQLDGRQIRPVGVGELLARLEYLKRHLASEGLFDADRKRPLPFLPRRVGLVCGRASAAERDVVANARRRWRAVRFEVRPVAVQGATAVSEVTAAIAELDAHPEVDVIVVARGGGSVEDLLPFSNETLLRAVAAARTPVVSAIGHDVDTPLLDLVADHRASTPTDAAKAVVPDAAAELRGVVGARDRARRALQGRLHAERRRLVEVRSRPVLADPGAYVRAQRDVVTALRVRASGRVEARAHRARDQVAHLRAQLRTLSPQSTLDRGYAVVSHADGRVVRDPAELDPGELLRVLVAGGDFGVRTVGPGDAGPSTDGAGA